MEKATLAGGCFWCIEAAFLDVWGIESVQSGYTGGALETPSYEEVCTGATGHFEAIHIVFDSQKITFLQILNLFWRQIDPFDAGGQFADRGTQYRTAIFYHDFHQKALAEKSKALVEARFGAKVATEILPAAFFYPAEEFHQGYCLRRPHHFAAYQSGHVPHLEELWRGQSPLFDEPKEYLTLLQYHVTHEGGTEPPFQNAYWDNHREGVYVDILSGEPLFDAGAKFDSGTGWPSFYQPLDPAALVELDDWSLPTRRTEVRGRLSGAHLGHLFPDGPPPTGLRYCMNSASLQFYPKL